MPGHALDVGGIPPLLQAELVSVALGKPAGLDPEDVDREEGEKEVGERADEHEECRQDGVEPTAASPGTQCAERGPDRESQNQADRPKQHGPHQALANDINHFHRELRQ